MVLMKGHSIQESIAPFQMKPSFTPEFYRHNRDIPARSLCLYQYACSTYESKSNFETQQSRTYTFSNRNLLLQRMNE